jgi:hypothetical protein
MKKKIDGVLMQAHKARKIATGKTGAFKAKPMNTGGIAKRAGFKSTAMNAAKAVKTKFLGSF